MRTITVADLRAIAGTKATPALASKLVGPINRHAAEQGIDTPLLMAHFLAHMAHETGGFKSMVESLNYSVQGLLSTFGRHRITEKEARYLGRQTGEKVVPLVRQQQIANTVYGGDWGKRNLGNVLPNDGWDFRGSGPYQLTGRSNFETFGGATGLDLADNPELARDPDTGVEIAAKYFAKRMKAAAARDDIAGTTKALNGGDKGLDDRKAALARAKKVLGYTKPAPKFALLPDPAPDEPAETPPVVENLTFEDEATVKAVQSKLRELGYAEVGVADGKLEDFTRKAIVLYRGDKGLPYSDKVDSQLLVKLFSDTEKRRQPEGRAEATSAEVRERIPEVAGNWKAKVTGWWTAGVSAIMAGVNAAWDYLGEAHEKLEPVKQFVGDVPTWFWFVIVAAGAFMLSRQFSKAEQAGVEAFREGARR